MTLLLLLALLRLVSKYSDLLSLAVLKNLSANSCTVNIRCTDLKTIVCSESYYLVESNCLVSLSCEFSMKIISPSLT